MIVEHVRIRQPCKDHCKYRGLFFFFYLFGAGALVRLTTVLCYNQAMEGMWADCKQFRLDEGEEKVWVGEKAEIPCIRHTIESFC